nr:MAG TPA: hypothetical protein [Caudoviricetes sp.]
MTLTTTDTTNFSLWPLRLRRTLPRLLADL